MGQRSKFYIVPLVVLALGVALFLFLAAGPDAPAPKAPEAQSALPVTVQTVTSGEQALTVLTQGTVQASEEIDLVSEVGGKIHWAADAFVSGGFFAAGDALLKIDAADYEIAKVRADARVAEAQEALATTRGQALQAKREWRDLGNTPANDLFLRKPQLARAEAQLAAAKAEARKAKLDLERTSLSLPFDGRILTTLVNRGQFLSPGQAVARVYATDKAEVRLPFTDRQLALLNLPLQGGEPTSMPAVELHGRFAGQDWVWEGRIVRTAGAIDQQSRVLYAVAEVEAPYKKVPGSNRPPLTIGQYVEAKVQGRRLGNILVVPRQALRANNTLWLIENQALRIAPIELVQLTDEYAAVSGLEKGTYQLVTSSIAFPVAGMSLSAGTEEPALVLEEAISE